MTSLGMTPAWRSEIRDKLGKNKTMPKTKAEMIAKLTPAMKDLISKKVKIHTYIYLKTVLYTTVRSKNLRVMQKNLG